MSELEEEVEFTRKWMEKKEMHHSSTKWKEGACIYETGDRMESMHGLLVVKFVV